MSPPPSSSDAKNAATPAETTNNILFLGKKEFFQRIAFQLRHARFTLDTVPQHCTYSTIISHYDAARQALSIPSKNYLLIAPTADEETKNLLRTTTAPVLFLHGTADLNSPPSHTEALSFHTTNKKILWIKDADHNFSQPYHLYQLIHHIIHHLKEPMCYNF